MEIQRTSLETFERYRARLRAEGQIRIRVESGSMEPLIPSGSEHWVMPLADTPRVFDLLVFRDRDMLLCHFVWSVNRRIRTSAGSWITTRCLASPIEDFPILEEQILGRLEGTLIPTRTRLKLVLKSWLLRFFQR